MKRYLAVCLFLLRTGVFSSPVPLEGCGSSADIVFVMDESGSISDFEFSEMKDFVLQVVEALGTGNNARFGLISYSDTATAVFDLNLYSSAMEVWGAISTYSRQFSGSTYTNYGLRECRQMFTALRGDRPQHTNIAIVLTDGQSADRLATESEATLCQQAGVRVIAMGIGSGADPTELNAMASDPDDQNVFTVAQFDALNSTISSICESVATLEVGNCETSADFIFVMDRSGSIGSNFPSMKQFVESVVTDLGAQGTARFGVISYSSYATTEFHLSSYTSVTDVLTAVNNLDDTASGGTNTADGLRLLREEFTTLNGDRPNATNIAIVMTDGYSYSRTLTLSEAEDCKLAGIRLIAIGVGQGTSIDELEGIASEPVSDNVFNVADFDALNNITSGICESVQNIDVTEEWDCTSNNPCPEELLAPTYFALQDKMKYIQCGPLRQCFDMSCPPGTRWRQEILSCAHDNIGGGGYDCASNNNPCANRPIPLTSDFYFTHTLPNKFIQCDQWGSCFEMPCAPGTEWNQAAMTCTVPTGRR